MTENASQSELEKQQPLLAKWQVIVAPNRINGDGFIQFLWALTEAREKAGEHPVHLLCRGDGGEAEVALGLYDLIKTDGNVHGYLMGMCASASGLLWAGCAKRYVYPSSFLGIHRSMYGFNAEHPTNAVYASQVQKRLETLDRRTAEIYAEISGKAFDFNWWMQQASKAMFHEMTVFSADELVKMEMAENVVGRTPFITRLTAAVAEA